MLPVCTGTVLLVRTTGSRSFDSARARAELARACAWAAFLCVVTIQFLCVLACVVGFWGTCLEALVVLAAGEPQRSAPRRSHDAWQAG